MIETRRLKNVVIFVQTILSFVLLRKIINFHRMFYNMPQIIFEYPREFFTFPGMFGNIPRIPFPVPVFLVLYIAFPESIEVFSVK